MPEARGYLRDLIEHATQREFVYTHKWRLGDLVMWDNRQTMHRARPFPAHEPRDMRRTTLAGDGPTAAADRRLIDADRLQPAELGAALEGRRHDAARRRGRGDGLRLPHRHRSCRAARHQGAGLSLLRGRRVLRGGAARAARAARWAWPGSPPRPRASGWSRRCWSCRTGRRCWRPRCWPRSTC